MQVLMDTGLWVALVDRSIILSGKLLGEKG